ncbi:MAG: ABC transporter ATP-binding protein [Armatimonadetes bacterium]|nr:ABC transporter ATP-binding protein [Armatimonadota bacterium]
MNIAILTENLKKNYKYTKNKNILALDNLNLEVLKGDIFGFIGPNGAGKTTAIKLLTGLIQPTGGKAYIFGELAGSIRAKKNIGYLSEIAYYYDFMEVDKLLHFYGSFFGISKIKREGRIKEILKMVDMTEKINSKIKDLSKGMLQRFGIAQALISNPPLLILDEPTSGLDPIGQKEIKDIILKLKEMGITIFFSSHKLTEVEHICDKIGIIHKGKMLTQGALGEFLKQKEPFLKLKFSFSLPPSLEVLNKLNLPETLKDNLLCEITVHQKDLNHFIDKLRLENAQIISIIPEISSLEDTFFNLIKEGEKNESS